MALRKELRKQGDFLFKYRSYLPIVVLIFGLLLYVEHVVNLEGITEADNFVYELGCLAVALVGFLVRMYTLGYAAKNTSGRNTSEGQVAEAVNTTGIYSQLRHPLYLGNFLIWLGIAAFTQNVWFVVAFTFMFWVYYERIMYAEEEYLIGKFSNEYLSWSAKTPAFIPAFKKWVPSKYEFSFKKIIKQEKAGIVNLFGVLLLFRATATYIANGDFYMVGDFWLYTFAISVAYYIVVKVLEKTTRIFDLDR